ncbi:hypothetical protein [uncultured Williamsia sp.]|uniref:hypothetical protein n=1 Tax=uncultured Williamsia sp. TaxID=259311 RepID=UPI002633C8C5|nr:hypothetical protein [uncultured Williamsia sp.]
MVHDGCWSTVICTEAERAALGDTSVGGWVVNCRLSIGHRGDHASDAEMVPRFDRRLWIQWNDAAAHAQSLIERNPCSAPAVTPCMLFEGHPGAHWFAPSNGHAPRPAPPSPPPAPPASPAQSTDIPQRAILDLATDVPSMRSRAVRTPGLDDPGAELPRQGRPVDQPRTPDQPLGRHGGPSRDLDDHRTASPSLTDPEVVAALDEVVVALSRLADLLRAPRGRRAREN